MLFKMEFQVIIYESTDVSVNQILAIVTRYFDHKKLDFVDGLLDTVTFDNGNMQNFLIPLNLFMKNRIFH